MMIHKSSHLAVNSNEYDKRNGTKFIRSLAAQSGRRVHLATQMIARLACSTPGLRAAPKRAAEISGTNLIGSRASISDETERAGGGSEIHPAPDDESSRAGLSRVESSRFPALGLALANRSTFSSPRPLGVGAKLDLCSFRRARINPDSSRSTSDQLSPS